MNVLVLNCGSSSIKYQLLNMDAVPVVLAKGIVEKIGLTYGSFTYKPAGFPYILHSSYHNYVADSC